VKLKEQKLSEDKNQFRADRKVYEAKDKDLWAIEAKLISLQINNRSTCILPNLLDLLIDFTSVLIG
jgi:hypothetical protein